MQCVKCGRDIESGRVFCQECLDEMEKYPVKPGTVVQLPSRPAQPPVKKPVNHRRKPALSPEEYIKKLKKRVLALSCALVLAVAVVAGLCYLLVKQYFDNVGKVLPGQNYSSITTTQTGETE